MSPDNNSRRRRKRKKLQKGKRLRSRKKKLLKDVARMVHPPIRKRYQKIAKFAIL